MSTKSEIPNEKFELIDCPVCESKNQNIFFDIPYGKLKQKPSLDYTSIGINKETRFYVKRCTECSFVFVNPRIKSKYESLIYNQSKINMYKKKSWILNVESKKNRIENRQTKLRCLKTVLELMENQDLNKDLTLFDFGCGFGNTLSVGRELGMDVYGVDIDEVRLKICRKLGFNVAKPDHFDEKFPFIKADIITIQNCIEHVVNLPYVMNYLREKSNKNCVLWVSGLTPRKISMEKKTGVFSKSHFVEHINYFPIKTLDLLFTKYGFEKIPPTISYPVTTLIDFIKLTLKFIFPESMSAYYFGGFSRMYRYK